MLFKTSSSSDMFFWNLLINLRVMNKNSIAMANSPIAINKTFCSSCLYASVWTISSLLSFWVISFARLILLLAALNHSIRPTLYSPDSASCWSWVLRVLADEIIACESGEERSFKISVFACDSGSDV